MGIIRMLKRKFSKKKKYSIEDIKLENNHINMIEKKSVKIHLNNILIDLFNEA